MFHRWAALVLVLALWAMSPRNAAGQTQVQQPRGHGAGTLGKNYPNPFNPETYMPFGIDPDVCADGSQQHVVTLRIMNILSQQVAVFSLQGASTSSTTSVPSSLYGAPLSNLKLGCGNYVGYWNMNQQGTTRAVSSGPYMVQLFVDGKLGMTTRIYVKK